MKLNTWLVKAIYLDFDRGAVLKNILVNDSGLSYTGGGSVDLIKRDSDFPGRWKNYSRLQDFINKKE